MSKRIAVSFAKPVRLVVGLLVAVACLPALRTKSDEPTKAQKPAADSMLGKEAGDVRDDNGLKLKLVWCPPGSVRMENSDGTPANTLLTQGYWIGRYEVTQAEWKHVMGTEPWNGQQQVKEGDDFPATFVTWDDAMSFGRKLTELERKAGRLRDDWEYTLPSEAQWERACRARTETNFSFGDDESKLGEYAWIGKNTSVESYAHRVGRKKPNPWGLYDVHGNVLEWCRDSWSERLPGGRDTVVEKAGETGRVIRGGGWSGIVAWSCRSAERFGIPHVHQRSAYYGFRVALTPVQPAK